MATVKLTRHLVSFFPDLEGRELELAGATVAELVRELDALAPGIAFYICDELGRLRTHVNVFIGEERIQDRRTLSDAVPVGSTVHILQALSGG